MRLLRMTAALVALAGTAWAAGIVDNFDTYVPGPLSVVSGGVWRTWGGNSIDAQVTAMGLSPPNAQYHDGVGVPDVVTYSAGNIFGGLGSQVTMSYNFLVHEGPPGPTPDKRQTLDTYFFIGSGNPAANDIDYGSCIGVFMIDWADIDVTGQETSVHLWDEAGAGGGGDYGILELARHLATDAWHNVTLIATQTVPDMTANPPADADGFFDVFVDLLPVAANVPFGLDNPLGLNGIELYSFEDEEPLVGPDDYHLFDDISITPEPASLALLALALVLRRR